MYAEKFKLSKDAKILVFNDEKVIGQIASARWLIVNRSKKYEGILREAIDQSQKSVFYHREVIVELDKEFSVKSPF